MSIMRQIGKQILTLTKTYGLLFVVCLGFAWPTPLSGQEKSFATNVLTGVAISGYDPVAYFTEEEARIGSPEFALEWGGVVWYFTSRANRDVFEENPLIYAPLFGGHGAMSMARGYLSDGNPQIFRIVADRLVLFYSVGNREAFDLAPERALADAIANWEALPDRTGVFSTGSGQPAAGG